MNAGLVSGLVTALLLLTFLGGVAWAWSGRRKQEFEEASRLPLEDAEK
jgi:cytochrome c oxidase cbb3-type subunit IV